MLIIRFWRIQISFARVGVISINLYLCCTNNARFNYVSKALISMIELISCSILNSRWINWNYNCILFKRKFNSFDY